MLFLCLGYTSHQQLRAYGDGTSVYSLIGKTGKLSVTKLKKATCPSSLIRVFSVHILRILRVSTLMTLKDVTELFLQHSKDVRNIIYVNGDSFVIF